MYVSRQMNSVKSEESIGRKGREGKKGVLTGIGRERIHGESRALKTPMKKAALRSLTAAFTPWHTPETAPRESQSRVNVAGEKAMRERDGMSFARDR